MDNNLQLKINRLNDLHAKSESGEQLSNAELSEQAMLRDEVINYFKYVMAKLAKK